MTCHGCNQPLEPLAQVRTYHSSCDPMGRVGMLEREIAAFLNTWDADFAHLPARPVSKLRAALDYRPAQMKGRE